MLLFGRVMQVCLGAVLCRHHQYTALSSAVKFLLGLSGKGQSSSGYKKSIHRKTTGDFTKCKSHRVTGHQPWFWSSFYAPWQPVPYLASLFLMQEWVTPEVVPACLLWTWCTAHLPLASGHQCTLEKHNSHVCLDMLDIMKIADNNIAMLISACKCIAVHLWDKMVH